MKLSTESSRGTPTLSIAGTDGGKPDLIRLRPASTLHGAREDSFTAESFERTLWLIARARGGRAELRLGARVDGASVVIPDEVSYAIARNLVTLALSTGRAAATEVANSDNAAASLLLMFPVKFDSGVGLGPKFRRLASPTVDGGSRFSAPILRNTSRALELDEALETYVELLLGSDQTREGLERHEANAVLHLSVRALARGAIVSGESLMQLHRIRGELNVDMV